MRTWILRRFRTYGQKSLLLAVFLSPVVFHRRTLDVFNLVKLSVIATFGLAAIVFWFAWSLERGIWIPRFSLGFAAGIFLTAFGLATLFSQNHSVSILGSYHRYGGFIPVATYVCLMLVMVGLFWERADGLHTVALTVALSSVPVALYALIQASGQDWIEWAGPAGESRFSFSTLGSSNFAGGYLGISLPFVVYLALSHGRPGAGLFLLLLPMNLAALWTTGSRGGFVAALAGLSSLTFLHRDRIHRWVKIGMAVLVALVAVLAVIVVWHPGMDEPPAALGELEVLRARSITVRQYYWVTAWRIFSDHPILGTGPDTYFLKYGQYRMPADGAELGLRLADKPHNIFLEYAANSGVLGLGSYLGVAGLALWYAKRRAGQADYAQRELTAAFASTFIAYLAQGFFSIDVPPLALIGWVAVGGIAVLADPGILSARASMEAMLAKKTGRKPKGGKVSPKGTDVEVVAARSRLSSPAKRRAVQAGAASVAVGLLVAGSRVVLADSNAQKARVSALQAQPGLTKSSSLGRAVDEIERAIRLHRREPTYYMTGAEYLLAQADSSQAKAEKDRLYKETADMLLRAQKLQPQNVFVAMALGQTYGRWGHAGSPEYFRQSLVWWQRAISLDPTDWQLNFNYGAFLNEYGIRTGQPSVIRDSIEALKRTARIRPDHPSIWRALGQSYLAIEDKERAREALRRTLSLSPGDKAARKLMAQTGG